MVTNCCFAVCPYARADHATFCCDRDDLRGAQIFDAEDFTANGGLIIEPHMFGANTENEIRLGNRFTRCGYFNGNAIKREAIGAECEPPRVSRKFIAGDPMKSATKRDAGRS